MNDGVETLGVTRDGDFIVKQNRNPAISKHFRTIQRNEPDAIRKSRRKGCTYSAFTESFGSICEKRADDSGSCENPYLGHFEANFYHPFSGSRQQITSLGSADFGDVILDDWYHIVFIRDKDFIVLYVNGVPVSATIKPLGDALENGESNGLMIGGVRLSTWSPDAVFNGRMDQPCAWNRMLTAEEIATLYSGGSGKAFSTWSDDLKADAAMVLEFNEELGWDSQNREMVGSPLNLIDQIPLEMRTSVHDEDRSFLRAGGVVSDFSFTPAFVDDLAYPVKEMSAAKAAVNNTRAKHHQTLLYTNSEFATAETFSMSIWVSPHGMAFSENSSDQLNDVNLGAFDLDGEMVQKTYGVLFSDYEGYTQRFTVDANFTLAFRGTFKNDPNATLIVPPGKTKNLTALPDVPGKVDNFVATDSRLVPHTKHNHAAMSENGKIVSSRLPMNRFINHNNESVQEADRTFTRWRVEISGHGEAPVKSDDGFGATVVGQDNAWGVHFDPKNHEGMHINRNTFTPDQHFSEQVYYIVFSIPRISTHFRWQNQTNLFDDRWYIFGTHEGMNESLFGVDVSLVDNLSSVEFRVMDENGEYEAAKFSIVGGLGGVAGAGGNIPMTMLTLRVNYKEPGSTDPVEPSRIHVWGHNNSRPLEARGKPPMVTNSFLSMRGYRRSGDSISIAEGPTVGSLHGGEPEHYLEMVIHEVAVSDPTTKWLTTTTPIEAPVYQKVEGFLAHKWGLAHRMPDTHPFKLQPPMKI